MMLSDAILNLVDSLVTLALVPLILLKARDKKVGRALAAWLFSVTIWSFGVAMHSLAKTNYSAMFWSRFLHYGAVPLPVLYLNFSLIFLGVNRPKLIRSVALLAFTFMCLIPTKYFIRNVSPILNFAAFPKAGLIYPFYLGMFTACVCISLFYYYKKISTLSGPAKNQVRAMFWGSAIGFGFGSTAFLPEFGIPIWPFGRPLVVFNAIFIAYSIIKHGFMDIKLILRDTTVHGLTATCLISICLLIGLPLSNYSPTSAVLLSTLVMTLLMSFAYEPIRRNIQPSIDRIVFANRFGYLEELSQLPNDMLEFTNLRELLSFLVKRLVEAGKLEHASVFMYDPRQQTFPLTIRYNNPITDTNGSRTEGAQVIGQDAAIAVSLKQSNRLWLKDQMTDTKNASVATARHELIDLKAAAYFGVMKEQELVGIVVLGHKVSNQIFNPTDLKILQALKLRLENFLVQAMITTQESLNMVKDSHDMKNDVNVLNARIPMKQYKLTMLEKTLNAKLESLANHAVNGSLSSEQVEQEISAMRALVSQTVQDEKNTLPVEKDTLLRLSNKLQNWSVYGRLVEGGFQGNRPTETIDVSSAANICTERWRPAAAQRNLELIPDIQPNLFVLGDQSLVQQILDNLVDNGIKATDRGHVKLTCSLQDHHVIIKVVDTGCGIPKEHLNNIFKKPFYQGRGRQSLERSTGVGLVLVAQYAKSLRGEVHVESEEGKGSTFIVSIPAHENAIKAA